TLLTRSTSRISYGKKIPTGSSQSGSSELLRFDALGYDLTGIGCVLINPCLDANALALFVGGHVVPANDDKAVADRRTPHGLRFIESAATRTPPLSLINLPTSGKAFS